MTNYIEVKFVDAGAYFVIALAYVYPLWIMARYLRANKSRLLQQLLVYTIVTQLTALLLGLHYLLQSLLQHDARACKVSRFSCITVLHLLFSLNQVIGLHFVSMLVGKEECKAALPCQKIARYWEFQYGVFGAMMAAYIPMVALIEFQLRDCAQLVLNLASTLLFFVYLFFNTFQRLRIMNSFRAFSKKIGGSKTPLVSVLILAMEWTRIIDYADCLVYQMINLSFMYQRREQDFTAFMPIIDCYSLAYHIIVLGCTVLLVAQLLPKDEKSKAEEPIYV